MSQEDPTITEVAQTVELLRGEVKGATLEPDTKARIMEYIENDEKRNQATLLAEKRADGLEEAIGTQKALIDELKTENEALPEMRGELKALEALIAQRGGQTEKGDAWKEEGEYAGLMTFAQKGLTGLNDETKALMRSDVDTDGGFLVPTEMDTNLQKEIVELDPIRPLARVRTIGAKAIEMPVRTDIPRATFEGEAALNAEDNSTYRLVTAVPYRQTITIPATMDLIMNSAFDIERELQDDAGIGFAEGEGQGFTTGTGVKEPEGVTQNPTVISTVDTFSIGGTDHAIASKFIEITGELKVGYNAVYNIHRRTLAKIRTLRDTQGRFLWQPGLNGPVGNTLNGFPYVLTPSMSPWDSIGGDAVIFGDWSRGYTIIDRVGMSVIRDNVTKKGQAIIEFTMHRWLTGIVTIPEAFRMLRAAA